MRVIEPGHVYELHNVDDYEDDQSFQRIVFTRRRDDDAKLLASRPGGGGRHEGILAQELLRVLIDRTLYLNAEVPCVENVAVIEHLRECLQLYESRAARRTIEKLLMPERADACPICHHLLCDHRHPERLQHESDR